MFILWKNVCSVRKRAYKKAYLWPIDYCTFKQNTREKNVQKTVFRNISTYKLACAQK